ncbi:carbohydrate-binding protein [Spirochaetia bacterium 38H-sp]|uniref:Carbohydrate-binding protein n=1 Tax=Rarispira pelagica TaxID=3141764 RepID=A0ABU9UAL5_9SPIR
MKNFLKFTSISLLLVFSLILSACNTAFMESSISENMLSRSTSYIDSSTARLWFDKSEVDWADVHYKINGGSQINVRMSKDVSYFWYDVTGLQEGDTVDYWFTIGYVSGAQDTGWYSYKHSLSSPAPASTSDSSATSFVLEAEDFAYMSGIKTESCSEGGFNVGWIDAGDWLAYSSMYFEEGDYLIEYRVASLSGGGRFNADMDAGSVQLGALDIPSTSGWQNWTTISHTVHINAGNHAFGIYALSGGWNINWIKFTYLSGTTPPPSTGDWSLVWSDEFDGNGLNTAYWTPEIGGGGWGNNELEYYTDRAENIVVSGGYLNIIARKESYGGRQYTSARLKTQDKLYKTYGKVEARIRLSKTGSGLWPAFWMLGNNISSVSWPVCGEIDIMEHVNTDSLIYGTIHWDASGHASYGGHTQADITQWHIYTIEWDSSSIKWFVDGTKYHEANIKDSINSTEEFHRPFFVLLNLAVGGEWPGFTIDESVFPVTMYVDWVRWYQK